MLCLGSLANCAALAPRSLAAAVERSETVAVRVVERRLTSRIVLEVDLKGPGSSKLMKTGLEVGLAVPGISL